MKAIFFTLIFCFGCVSLSLAQVTEKGSQQTPQQLYDYHFSKKRTNTAVGFIALGSGIAMVAGGISTNLNKCLLSDCQDGMALVYSGIGAGLSSIYFFINASKHKKKAKIQLQNGVVGINSEFRYTGILVSFNF